MRRTLVFVGLIVLVVLWIGSGMITREPIVAPERPEARIPTVAASWSEAEQVVRELVLYGDVEPTQVATIRARTDGIVEEVVSQGTRVETGDMIAQLSSDDRQARLAPLAGPAGIGRARLSRRRTAGRTRCRFPRRKPRARLAQLEAARAELRAIELEIGKHHT